MRGISREADRLYLSAAARLMSSLSHVEATSASRVPEIDHLLSYLVKPYNQFE
jgi:hypothetical protein